VWRPQEPCLSHLVPALPPARRPQVLLLEAYEQLENDVAKEVDRALGKQAEEMQRLQRRVDFLQVCARGDGEGCSGRTGSRLGACCCACAVPISPPAPLPRLARSCRASCAYPATTTLEGRSLAGCLHCWLPRVRACGNTDATTRVRT
jgi:hypothetical protein